MPHRGLTRRSRSSPARPASLCGSAALPRAQARQLRANARGSRPELAEGVVMVDVLITSGATQCRAEVPFAADLAHCVLSVSLRSLV
jgi:hypothetical protein